MMVLLLNLCFMLEWHILVRLYQILSDKVSDVKFERASAYALGLASTLTLIGVTAAYFGKVYGATGFSEYSSFIVGDNLFIIYSKFDFKF